MAHKAIGVGVAGEDEADRADDVDAVGLEKEAEVDYLASLSELRYLTVLLWEPPG